MNEREGTLIDYFERTEPIEMLEEIGGHSPFPTDVKLINRLETLHGLTKPVINVLLQYVILSDNGKIHQTRVLRMASHLKMNNIETAQQAFEFFKAQHALKKKWEEENLRYQGGKDLRLFTSDETYQKFTEILQHNGHTNVDDGFQSLVNQVYKEHIEIEQNSPQASLVKKH